MTILSLGLGLLGTIGVAALLYAIRFTHGGVYDAYYGGGIPLRVVFVLFLAAASAPFLVSIFYRVPVLFLIVPIILDSLLYPIFSPFGLPTSRDPTFVFQFAQSLGQVGSWVPGSFVTNQAGTYSYFPGAGVFNLEFSIFTGVPLVQVFNWAQPALRLLLLPAIIYALTARIFGTRYAMLAVFLYLAVPSTELNISTQQDFSVPFLALSILLLALLLETRGKDMLPLRALIVVFSSFVVLDHHLSSYITAAWLVGIAVLPYLVWGAEKAQKAYPVLRPIRGMTRYLVVFLLYVVTVSAPAVFSNFLVLQKSIATLTSPTGPTARSNTLGATFPTYQLAWIFLSVGLLVLCSILVLRHTYKSEKLTFVTMNVVIGVLFSMIAIIFLPTGLGILALRILEYAGIILVPATAWFLIRRVAGQKTEPPTPQRSPALRRLVPRFAGVTAVVLAFLIFTGGAMVSLSTRDAFAPKSAALIDAPRYISGNAYEAALWAESHLNISATVWGDYLAYSVFGGFATMEVRYNCYELFNGTTLASTNWTRVVPGDYIITDVYMDSITPEFPGPRTSQPTGPLPIAEVQKFNAPGYFSQIYQDSLFTVYLVVKVP
ncbi:MAG: hypothetical protein L3K14_00390 [Thermoplasmata archaeon]|nr:hypothetical protein [Thermoplasmata archaeon]